jgi:hypothetical protein
LDTGSGVSVVSQRTASKLGLKTTGTVIINDVTLDTIDNVIVALGGATYSSRRVLVDRMDWLNEPFMDGRLGCELLRNFVVEIDYQARRLRLRDPKEYKPPGAGDQLLMRFDAMRFDPGIPSVNATILAEKGSSLDGMLSISTGLSRGLYLEHDFSKRHNLLAAAGLTESGRGAGISGTSLLRSGHLHGLHLGHYVIGNPTTIFWDERRHPRGIAGAIGGDVLRRFRIVFDYGRKQVSFEPNGESPKPVLSKVSGSQLAP